MRILYGVSGVGLGHASRAKEIISHLEKNNHKVLVFTYGEAYKALKSKFNVYKIHGVPLHFKKGELSVTLSTLSGIKALFQNLNRRKEIKKTVENFSPEVCITDMEPLTSLISYIYSLPLISINNQHMLTMMDLEVPSKHQGGSFMAKLTTHLTAPKADAYMILSFSKDKSKRKGVHPVCPIVRKEIVNLKSRKSNFILVYQTRLSRDFISVLEKIPEKFVLYGYKKPKNSKKSNLTYKVICYNFIKDLAKAKAVIGTAGFSLISESLYLKKPYFAVPLKGQFEQTVNALFIKREGFGDFSDSPNKEQIQNFISHLPSYERSLKKYKSNPREAPQVLDKLLREIKTK